MSSLMNIHEPGHPGTADNEPGPEPLARAATERTRRLVAFNKVRELAETEGIRTLGTGIPRTAV